MEQQNENQIMANSIYEIRMNEFCVNHLQVPLTLVNDETVKRPKCSVSPIDNSNLAIDESYYLQNSTNLSIASPYVNKISEPTKTYLPINPFIETVLQENNHNTSNASVLATSSPFITNRVTKTHCLSKNLHLKNVLDLKPHLYQSTPNKPQMFLNAPAQTAQSSRVNFHSILDLAKSDDLKANDSSSLNPVPSFSLEANSSGYASVSSTSSLNSTHNNNNNNTNCNSSLIDFNEQLKHFYTTSCNKENSKTDFISKVI